jgi:hypothetical protein
MEVKNMANEVKFADTVIEIDEVVVAKVTAFNRAVSIDEEDVTGSEDVVAGSDVLQKQFVAIAVGETANVEGIAIESADSGLDAGQSDLRDAAESGETVVLRHTRATGYGHAFTGFFTSYNESGSTSSVYRFTGAFRINSKEEITPAS